MPETFGASGQFYAQPEVRPLFEFGRLGETKGKVLRTRWVRHDTNEFTNRWSRVCDHRLMAGNPPGLVPRAPGVQWQA
jgi:hypothetical protein